MIKDSHRILHIFRNIPHFLEVKKLDYGFTLFFKSQVSPSCYHHLWITMDKLSLSRTSCSTYCFNCFILW